MNRQAPSRGESDPLISQDSEAPLLRWQEPGLGWAKGGWVAEQGFGFFRKIVIRGAALLRKSMQSVKICGCFSSCFGAV
jgi:hypothetical protein